MGKRAGSDVILDAVGVDHAPWLACEIGPVGVVMLCGVRNAVDPTGVLNPGVGDHPRRCSGSPGLLKRSCTCSCAGSRPAGPSGVSIGRDEILHPRDAVEDAYWKPQNH